MSDRITPLEAVLRFGPQPRLPIGGSFHPNAVRAKAAEAAARQERVQLLMAIREQRKDIKTKQRALDAARARLAALELEAGGEGALILAKFRSPAVPVLPPWMLRRHGEAVAGCCQRLQDLQGLQGLRARRPAMVATPRTPGVPSVSLQAPSDDSSAADTTGRPHSAGCPFTRSGFRVSPRARALDDGSPLLYWDVQSPLPLLPELIPSPLGTADAMVPPTRAQLANARSRLRKAPQRRSSMALHRSPSH